jgi:ATP/maltotriose-dependent transcriptional regulator MalT
VLFRELGMQTGHGIAYSLEAFAYALFFQGDISRAHTLAQECLALEREFGNKVVEAHMLALLGEITLQQGDPPAARLLLEQSCALVREAGLVREVIDEEHQMDGIVSHLAKVLAIQGDYPAARALYEKSLESLIRVPGVNMNLFLVDPASILEGLAVVVSAQGDLAWAARLWGSAAAQRGTSGIPLPPVYRADYERAVADARTQCGEKAFAAAWAQGRTMTLEHVLAAQGPVSIPLLVSTDPVTAPPVPKSSAAPEGLTAREVEVLRLVALGLADAQVA